MEKKAQAAGGEVRREMADGVATLTMSYPERRNALSLPLRAQLTEHMAELMADKECRVIVLTGDAGVFCSGGDISGMEGITGPSGRARLQTAHRLIRLMMEGEKPIVAAVEGHAAGAGISIAAACDIVVTARDAKFTCSFNKIGLVPDLGILWSLPLRVGIGRAKLITMLAETFDGAEAERIGLAEFVVEPGQALAKAQEVARRLAAGAPLSQAMTKAMLARMPQDLADQLRAEADAQAILFTSEDFVEGRTAFMEKRKPAFRGR